MPLPAIFFALWAIWPLASYPGGKLFAPLVVLIGLFAIPQWKSFGATKGLIIGALLLIWISLSALWSPAGEQLFSGQFLGENFALEASYLRLALTMVGSFLFVKLVMGLPSDKVDKLPFWIYGGLIAHLLIVIIIAIYRQPLLASQGDTLVLTGQSMGRNINLLALGAPLLFAGLVTLKDRRYAMVGGPLLVALLIWLALRLDGLAAILALGLGAVAFAVIHLVKEKGFRVLFNMLAGAILLAPAIAFTLAQLAPSLSGSLPLTTQQRIIIWQATLERIMEKPLFGHGVNAAPTWSETYASRPEFLEQLLPEMAGNRIIPSHPHNMAMQLWAETGLIGVLLVCALIVFVGRLLPAPKTLARGPSIAAAGVFGAALAYFSVSYSVWDESFWASVVIVASGAVIMHKKSMA